jgi:hypothetical protein
MHALQWKKAHEDRSRDWGQAESLSRREKKGRKGRSRRDLKIQAGRLRRRPPSFSDLLSLSLFLFFLPFSFEIQASFSSSPSTQNPRSLRPPQFSCRSHDRRQAKIYRHSSLSTLLFFFLMQHIVRLDPTLCPSLSLCRLQASQHLTGQIRPSDPRSALTFLHHPCAASEHSPEP